MDTKRHLFFLVPYLKRYKFQYTLLFIFIIIGMVLNIAIAWFFQNITNSMINGTRTDLLLYFILGISIIIIMMITNYINTFYTAKTTNLLKHDIRMDLFNHMIQFPIGYFDSNHSGDIQARIHQDTEQLNGVLGHNIIQFIILPISGLISFIYLSSIHIPMALITLLLGPLVLLVSKIFGYTIRNNGIEIQNNLAKTTQQLQEALAGHMIIKANSLERVISEKYFNRNKDLLQTQIKEGRLSGLLQALSIGISYCSQILVFAIGCFFVADNKLRIGDLLAFIVLSQSLITPFSNMGNLWVNLQRSLAALTRIHEFLGLPKDNILEKYKVEQVPINVEFRNVTFSYDSEKRVLDSINLKITSGQRVAIIGESGSGKSTLMKILLGLYHPTEGEVLLQPENQDSLKLEGINPYTAYVPQDHFLFDDTIYENIKYGDIEASEEQVYKASCMASAHPFIINLPDKYHFRVGERGSRLSGGQRQRVTLARAFVGSHSIIVLDEATSALDISTEESIIKQLDLIRQDQTLIMITHRLSTAIECDTIIFMENGRILGTGTHLELLRTNEKYQELYERYMNASHISHNINTEV